VTALPGLAGQLPAAYGPFRHVDNHVAPIDLRPACLAMPAPVGFFVFPSYGEGKTTELTPMRRGETLIALIECCFNLPSIRIVATLAGEPGGSGPASERASKVLSLPRLLRELDTMRAHLSTERSTPR
jgi:hypothetical protein